MEMNIARDLESQLTEFNQAIKVFGKDIEKIYVQSIRLSLRDLLKELKNNAPVDTGATKRALGIIGRQNRVSIGVRPGMFEAKKGNIQPRYYSRNEEVRKPWFRPTWDRHSQNIERKLLENLQPAVERVAKNIEKRVEKKQKKSN